MGLDIRTLMVVLAVTSFGSGLVIFHVFRMQFMARGVMAWVAGSLFLSLSLMLLALRGQIPDWLSILVANHWCILSYGLIWTGFRMFLGRPARPVLVAAMAVLPISVHVWFTYVEDWMAIRSAATILSLAFFTAANSYELLRGGARRYGRPQEMLGQLFCIETVAYVGWVALVLAGDHGNSFLAMGDLFAFLHLFSILYVVVYTGGIVAMISERFKLDLAQARNEAQRSDRAKSRFMASMSHELRNPLNGLMGMLGLLDGTPLDGSQRQYLTGAMSSARTIRELTGDLFDLAKIEAGRQSLVKEVFDLRLLSREWLAPIESEARAKGLDFTLDFGMLPRLLVGDSRRLGQVLANLASNAVKYTVSGGVSISMSEEDGGDEDALVLRVEVRDTGKGIGLEWQESIFEEFARGEEDGRSEGAGLGLSICRQLAELMGGGIAMESSPGRGSTFTFRARLGMPAPEEAEAFARQWRDERSNHQGVPQHGPLRVLLVEDNRINATYLSLLLERLGHHVRAVADGHQALRALEEDAFHVIFMDVRMPGMDGKETTRRIRALADADRASIPVVAVTADIFDGARERLMAAGMDACLEKPVNQEELVAVLARFAPDPGGGENGPGHGEPDSGAPAEQKRRVCEVGNGLVDWGTALEMFGGVRQDLEAYCGVAAILMAKDLHTMRELKDSGPDERLWRLVHSMKSNVRTFGARALAASLQRVESEGRAGRAAEAVIMLEKQLPVLEQLRREVALASGSGGEGGGLESEGPDGGGMPW